MGDDAEPKNQSQPSPPRDPGKPDTKGEGPRDPGKTTSAGLVEPTARGDRLSEEK